MESGDYAAASINYRLSGEATWPAQIHDVKAAIRWIRANAAKYGLDPDRIGVIGASAGGHLAAMLGTGGGVKALEGDVGPHRGVSSRVKCVVDLFGPSDLPAMGGLSQPDRPQRADSPESALIGGALPEHKDSGAGGLADHLRHPRRPALPDLPRDRGPARPVQPVGAAGQALKDAGVSCIFVKVVEAGHGGFRTPEVGRRIRQFLDKHLRDQPVGEVSDAPILRNPAKATAKHEGPTGRAEGGMSTTAVSCLYASSGTFQ